MIRKSIFYFKQKPVAETIA